MREITLGQYYTADSVIHRLDPRTKLFITFVFLAAAILIRNPLHYPALFVSLVLYVALSRVPVRYMLRGLMPLMVLIVFSMVMHLFTRTGNVIFSFGGMSFTDIGVQNAFLTGARMIMMLLGASLLTYTTTPTDLAEGIERGLHWMKRFQVPIHDVAMMMSIALRFIPVLVEELNRIMKAQMSRGVCFDEGNIIVRLKKLVPVIVPLFVSAVRRSNELATAMEARCYHGGEGRTKMMPLEYQLRDYIVYGFVILYSVGLFVLAIKF